MSKELVIHSYLSINKLEKLVETNPEEGVTYSKHQGIISKVAREPEVPGCILHGYEIDVKLENEKIVGFDITDIQEERLIKEGYLKDIRKDLIDRKVIVYLKKQYDILREKNNYFLQNVKIFFDD